MFPFRASTWLMDLDVLALSENTFIAWYNTLTSARTCLDSFVLLLINIRTMPVLTL